jgi:hypothetical protein
MRLVFATATFCGPRGMYGLGPYANQEWRAYGMLFGFPLQGVHRFESPQLSDMSNHLFVAVIT